MAPTPDGAVVVDDDAGGDARTGADPSASTDHGTGADADVVRDINPRTDDRPRPDGDTATRSRTRIDYRRRSNLSRRRPHPAQQYPGRLHEGTVGIVGEQPVAGEQLAVRPAED